MSCPKTVIGTTIRTIKNANFERVDTQDLKVTGNLSLEGTLVTGTSQWVQYGQDIIGEATGDQSGISMSLSSDGTTVAIGARYNDGNGDNSGHTRIYDWDGSDWIQRGQDIDGESAADESGWSVSLSSDGNTVAIGAIKNDGVNGADSGHTRIFDWDGTMWAQRGQDIDGEDAGDQSGFGVSLSSDGNTVAIGAIYNDGNGSSSGHTRVFDYVGTDWVQRGNDIDGEIAVDWSGYSVSLSSDGNTVAISAPLNDANGDASGHVRVFDWIGTLWIQRGQDIDGESGSLFSGSSVSLSSDGNTVAFTAPGLFTQITGEVLVFDWIGTMWVKREQNIVGKYNIVSLSSDGNTIAMSANPDSVILGTPISGTNSIVLSWNGTFWEQSYFSSISGTISLSSDGNIVAIGSENIVRVFGPSINNYLEIKVNGESYYLKLLKGTLP
jgi:hypothetical protein